MGRAMDEVLHYLGVSPWWETRPERHVFFFMSGIGAGIVPTWRKRLAPAIFVVAEGDRQVDTPALVARTHARTCPGAYTSVVFEAQPP